MKNILKNYTYLSLFLALSLVISSCTSDDTGESDVSKVIPVINALNGETVAFVNETFTYTLQPHRGGSEYVWTVTGADMAPVDGRPDQIAVTFTQFTQPVSISVYEMAANGSASEPMTTTVTVFGTPCDWTLEAIDTYGDGWDGAYVELAYSNIIQQYTFSSGGGETFIIPIPDGQDYTFTYVTGNFENEHRFTLIAPDGTVVAEEGCPSYACEPTPGLIASGTNTCP